MQDIFKGRWNELKGKVRQRWGELTDDEIAQTQGNLDQLVGRIQQKIRWNQRRDTPTVGVDDEMMKSRGNRSVPASLHSQYDRLNESNLSILLNTEND